MGNYFEGFNWVAILVAALAYFALGALWYSKLLFVKRWIADLKIDVNDPNAKKGMGLMFGGSLLLMLIQCLAIAVLAERLGLSGNGFIMSGVKLGVLTGCCFCAASTGVNCLYEKKPLSLFLINGGYMLAGNIIAAIIICSWA
jgi:Protein of unknown function (DUF1761)